VLKTNEFLHEIIMHRAYITLFKVKIAELRRYILWPSDVIPCRFFAKICTQWSWAEWLADVAVASVASDFMRRIL